MSKIVEKNYSRWLNSSKVSNEDKEILKKMTPQEKDDAFFKVISFGTGGMRGILGPGTNRINEHIIRRVSVGYGLFLLKRYKDAKERGVAISHDNRHFSREFTLETSKILNEMGINTFIFDSLRPTPELSYAVRYKHCIGGIMITASHNPKEHNGYKVYDETGCQLVPEKIEPMLRIIKKLPNELDVEVPVTDVQGKQVILEKDVDDTYVKLVEGIQINKDLNKDNFKIVYTPNHGTSYVNAMRVFKECGYDVYPVEKQCTPDPDFSGTLSPNPEDPRSFIEPIKLAQKVNADLIVMTDPDGDRCGLACKEKDGTYTMLTGNESAAVLLDYILSQKKEKGILEKNGVMFNTVVTSEIGKEIATSYGVKTEQFLTGFKYIGDRLGYYDTHKGPVYEFGYEESYGCLPAPFVRDKDGIQAILLYSECALYYHLQGITMSQAYHLLGLRYGFHKNKLYNIYFKGSEGQKKMDEIMEQLMTKPFTAIGGVKVKIYENYFKLERHNLKTKKITPIEGLPIGDLVKFYLADGTNICLRPSGTEPKFKIYIESICDDETIANSKPDVFYKEISKLLGIND
ncbi:MAG: phospho-sugar mutase [Bacilli bacterium]